MGAPSHSDLFTRARAWVMRHPWRHGSLTFDLNGQGYISIHRSRVSAEEKDADLVITASPETLAALALGQTDFVRAYMQGQLAISDMQLAMTAQHDLATLLAKMT